MLSMAAEFTVGDPVQTPLGKGVVRAVRNNGQLLIDVHGRAVVMDASSVTTPEAHRRAHSPPASRVSHRAPHPDPVSSRRTDRASAEVDLHGLTVPDALARAEHALNDAMLADVPEIRLIHGRSGGRIRSALHRRLQQIPSVRAFRVDPRNDGVTIVTL